MTAILVQPQLDPQPMEDEVIVLFAATRGYLDQFETSRLQEWSRRFVAFVHEKYPAITDTIRDTGALSDDVEKQLIAAIEDFNRGF